MRTLQAPMIHINGSDKECLCSDLQQAGSAIQKALKALSECSPNERDYYLFRDDAWKRADAQHRHRMQLLQMVREELALINEAILQGKTDVEVVEDDDDGLPNDMNLRGHSGREL